MTHLDFHGRGYVTLEDFLSSRCIKRLNMDKADVLEFVKSKNLFNINDPKSQVNFEKMSKCLFP